MGKIILITLFGFWYVINLYNFIRNKFYNEYHDVEAFRVVNFLGFILGIVVLIIATWSYIPFY